MHLFGAFSQLFTLLLLLAANAEFTPEVHKLISDSVSQQLVYFDDSPVVLNLNNGQLWRSDNDGKEWKRALDANNVAKVHIDTVRIKRAFIFTSGKTHYVTNDRGNTWKEFTVDADVSSARSIPYLSVSYKDPNLIIVGLRSCRNDDCRQIDPYFTSDGFLTNPKRIDQDLVHCTFTKSSADFDQGPDNRILCLRKQNEQVLSTQLVSSDDFFKTEPRVIDDTAHMLGSSHVYLLNVIHGFITAVALTKERSSRSYLFVSRDGETFNKAILDGELVTEGIELLPSSKFSLHIEVRNAHNKGRRVSNIMASDIDGLHFRSMLGGVESTQGFLNLDKIETVEGAWTANVMEDYDQRTLQPLTRTKISLDDGRSWNYLRVSDECPGDEHCSLNVLSLEERSGDGQGRTGATPGILLAIGNEGDRLGDEVLDLHTYVSRDGGLTWKKTLEEPAIFAFGDLGNVIVATPYSKKDSKNLETNKLYYSLDQANTWKEYKLDTASFPFLLTTAIDGTTTRFLYGGLFGKMYSRSQVLYSIDFGGAFDRNCDKDDDFEIWTPNRKDGDSCLFGHKDSYKRRKQEAKCFVNKVFEDLKIEETPCDCQKSDYECNFGFVENSKGECVFDLKLLKQMCSDAKEDNLKLDKQRKIVGNICEEKDKSFVEQVEFDCNYSEKHEVEAFENKFHGFIVSYTFLHEGTESGTDEIVLLRTTDNKLFISRNGGVEFKEYEGAKDKEVFGYFLNPYFKDDVYLISSDRKIHVSHDRAISFDQVSIPADINQFAIPLFKFKNNSRDDFIYYGEEGCDSKYSSSCHPVAFITRDSGKSWNKLISNIRECDFVGSRYTEHDVSKDMIFCQVAKEDGTYSLISSSDFFKTSEVKFENIVGFATTSHFTVVAAVEGDSLKAYVTIDGSTFAPALFPEDIKVDKQQAYTILDSETGAIFLHVTTNQRDGTEFGSILKSNSNGTSYVLVEQYSNRNEKGFVDFERVEGLEGIALINTVRNPQEAKSGSLKQLQSRITFNDGSDWEFLTPPSSDSNGNKYECIGKSLFECSLHLHGYTERKDYRDTYSSGSAIGLLIGVGNVGEKLGAYNDGSTFMTRDGGLTWKEIKKGVYQWEFGDRGSIIALVDDQFSTNVIYYSLDEGNSWEEFQFSEEKVKVDDIVTVPSDDSKKFLLVTRSEASKGSESKTIAVDFGKIFSRECKLDLKNPDSDDFEYWTPRNPYSSSECLFGHESQYLRKVLGQDCFIGKAPLIDAHKIVRNCPCNRRDYECDFNYVKDIDGTCKLIKGLSPQDASEICKLDSNAVEYFEPTGYRKVPMSTCEGGQEFDKAKPKPCKGKESEFMDRYGGKVSGSGLFLVIALPILIFIFALWFVYDRGIRRNGGLQRFGEIRLGEEDDLIENNKTDMVVNKIVRGGITVIAAGIATFKMIKILDAALINKVKGLFSRGTRYNSRGELYTTVGQTYRDDDDDDDGEDILGQVIDDEDYEIDDDEEAANHQQSEPGDHTETDIQNYSQYEDDRNLE